MHLSFQSAQTSALSHYYSIDEVAATKTSCHGKGGGLREGVVVYRCEFGVPRLLDLLAAATITATILEMKVKLQPPGPSPLSPHPRHHAVDIARPAEEKAWPSTWNRWRSRGGPQKSWRGPGSSPPPRQESRSCCVGVNLIDCGAEAEERTTALEGQQASGSEVQVL